MLQLFQIAFDCCQLLNAIPSIAILSLHHHRGVFKTIIIIILGDHHHHHHHRRGVFKTSCLREKLGWGHLHSMIRSWPTVFSHFFIYSQTKHCQVPDSKVPSFTSIKPGHDWEVPAPHLPPGFILLTTSGYSYYWRSSKYFVDIFQLI